MLTRYPLPGSSGALSNLDNDNADNNDEKEKPAVDHGACLLRFTVQDNPIPPGKSQVKRKKIGMVNREAGPALNVVFAPWITDF